MPVARGSGREGRPSGPVRLWWRNRWCGSGGLDRGRRPRITLHVSAETAAERIAPTTGALEPIDEHSCTLRAGSNSLDELAIYVATKGFDFQVHEPPELVEHVRTLAARLTSAAEQVSAADSGGTAAGSGSR
ncbi:WYL domain-containing protein [Micromonospora echinaurantiaca]|uniref:WYL domain-containing protein n=1 Tax=Micromonospora echinaurantiaca TaxID=47857 RepID=UPI001E595F87|nr:WYL domain-containing protein [Micromonospora echinaurantiaca]